MPSSMPSVDVDCEADAEVLCFLYTRFSWCLCTGVCDWLFASFVLINSENLALMPEIDIFFAGNRAFRVRKRRCWRLGGVAASFSRSLWVGLGILEGVEG